MRVIFKKITSIFKSKAEVKKRVRRINIESYGNHSVVTAADIISGKELFWGRYPLYPEMGSLYRKLFQSLKINSTKVIKVYESECGSDMCHMVSGNGPRIDYFCTDLLEVNVIDNLTKYALNKKAIRLSVEELMSNNAVYFAHVLSFIPILENNIDIYWDKLAETTVPGGYVIVLKKIKGISSASKLKAAHKKASNTDFYYYTEVDHTKYWVDILVARIENIKKVDPKAFSKSRKEGVLAFKEELMDWVDELKALKSGKLKIVTTVYKHSNLEN